jgi:hypothetical protein
MLRDLVTALSWKPGTEQLPHKWKRRYLEVLECRVADWSRRDHQEVVTETLKLFSGSTRAELLMSPDISWRLLAVGYPNLGHWLALECLRRLEQNEDFGLEFAHVCGVMVDFGSG